MLIPVRCFTCGSPDVSRHWIEFERRRERGDDLGKIMDELGFRRYCCRTVMLCQPDLARTIIDQTTPSVRAPRTPHFMDYVPGRTHRQMSQMRSPSPPRPKSQAPAV